MFADNSSVCLYTHDVVTGKRTFVNAAGTDPHVTVVIKNGEISTRSRRHGMGINPRHEFHDLVAGMIKEIFHCHCFHLLGNAMPPMLVKLRMKLIRKSGTILQLAAPSGSIVFNHFERGRGICPVTAFFLILLLYHLSYRIAIARVYCFGQNICVVETIKGGFSVFQPTNKK